MDIITRKVRALWAIVAAYCISHRRSLTIAAITMTPVLATTAASAQPTTGSDLLNGAGSTFFTSITSFFTGSLLPLVLGLLALTVGASMLIGWGRRAAKSK